MTKEDIIKAIWNEFPDITINETRKIYEATMNLLKETLAKGDPIEIRGFGKFTVKEKNPRIGRNPRTGEDAVIEKRKVVVFKASKNFKNIADNESSD